MCAFVTAAGKSNGRFPSCVDVVVESFGITTVKLLPFVMFCSVVLDVTMDFLVPVSAIPTSLVFCGVRGQLSVDILLTRLFLKLTNFLICILSTILVSPGHHLLILILNLFAFLRHPPYLLSLVAVAM